MNNQFLRKSILSILMVVSVIVSACVPIVPSAKEWHSDVKTHPSRGDVEIVSGSSAQIVTGANGATLSYNATELNPGHVYTVWFVLFNQPEECAASPCTGKDLLGTTDAVGGEAGYATGQIADENGRASFFAHMNLGDVPNAWFGNGFTNPNAEIHLVLMDHGPQIEDKVDAMLGTLRGGCTDESVPAAYPDTAKADGFAGPNRCQLYQVAIFVQA